MFFEQGQTVTVSTLDGDYVGTIFRVVIQHKDDGYEGILFLKDTVDTYGMAQIYLKSILQIELLSKKEKWLHNEMCQVF